MTGDRGRWTLQQLSLQRLFAEHGSALTFKDQEPVAVAAGGGLLVVLGFLPKLAAVIAGIPRPVLGGASLVMFGIRPWPVSRS